MAFNLGEIILTAVLILKCRRRIDGDERLGQFLYHAKWTRCQIGIIIVMILGYFILLFKTFTVPIQVGMWTGVVVHVLFPLSWIAIIAWPDAIYEGGVGCDFSYILSTEIEDFEKLSDGHYRLKIKGKDLNEKSSYRIINIGKGRSLPFC